MGSFVEGQNPAEERLRSLEALTDAALAHLDVEELLKELLDRVSEILNTDTAAVLLRDGSDLIATAARGLELEVRQGVRIPMGTGFAGRIAAERRAVMLDRVDHTTVANPILWERGIQSMMGVPLLAGGDLIGVLHVGTLNPRKFTPEDAGLLQLVADRIALATQAGLMEEERAAARILQRILLPSALPTLPTLEFAARYVPSAEIGVGGDWYDVFALPSGALCVVMGDVIGHGLRAAAVMGRLRASIRANALHSAQPEEVLRFVDRDLHHFEPGEMATVLLAVFEPHLRGLKVSSAGHPAPVLAAGDGRGAFVEMSNDPLLGVQPDIERAATTVHIPPGGVLLLYTDGLVERRETPLEVGLGELLDAVVPDNANSVCANVMRRLVGDRTPRDDIAVLAIRRTAQPQRGVDSGSPDPILVGPEGWWASRHHASGTDPAFFRDRQRPAHDAHHATAAPAHSSAGAMAKDATCSSSGQSYPSPHPPGKGREEVSLPRGIISFISQILVRIRRVVST